VVGVITVVSEAADAVWPIPGSSDIARVCHSIILIGLAVAVKPPTITNYSVAAVLQLLWGATEVWL
jgi:hypothetical protein